MKTQEEIFGIWAPTSSAWAPWISPVLFADLDCQKSDEQSSVTEHIGGWLPRVTDKAAALILNLPGQQSLKLSAGLARNGWRPVPVYNCSPLPSREASPVLRDFRQRREVIDTEVLRRALCSQTTRIASITLDADAPPAFLIDSLRLTGEVIPERGMFDNRWKLYEQDFPSAEFFRRNRIVKIVVVHEGLGKFEVDLRQILIGWQAAGVEIWERRPNFGSTERRVMVKQLSALGKLWFRIKTLLMRRSGAGSGFGHFVTATGG